MKSKEYYIQDKANRCLHGPFRTRTSAWNYILYEIHNGFTTGESKLERIQSLVDSGMKIVTLKIYETKNNSD